MGYESRRPHLTALQKWFEENRPKRYRNVSKKRKRVLASRRARKAARAHKQRLRRRLK